MSVTPINQNSISNIFCHLAMLCVLLYSTDTAWLQPASEPSPEEPSPEWHGERGVDTDGRMACKNFMDSLMTRWPVPQLNQLWICFSLRERLQKVSIAWVSRSERGSWQSCLLLFTFLHVLFFFWFCYMLNLHKGSKEKKKKNQIWVNAFYLLSW